MKGLKRIALLFGEWDSVYHRTARLLGLPDSMLSVLYTLLLFDGTISLMELRRLCALPTQTINSVLRSLGSKGHIAVTEESPKTKRVTLTETGRVAADQTAGRLIRLEDEILDSWDTSERDRFLAGNKQCAGAFRYAPARLEER